MGRDLVYSTGDTAEEAKSNMDEHDVYLSCPRHLNTYFFREVYPYSQFVAFLKEAIEEDSDAMILYCLLIGELNHCGDPPPYVCLTYA